MSTDLTDYGKIKTKDVLARKIYNNETAEQLDNNVGLIIESNHGIDIGVTGGNLIGNVYDNNIEFKTHSTDGSNTTNSINILNQNGIEDDAILLTASSGGITVHSLNDMTIDADVVITEGHKLILSADSELASLTVTSSLIKIANDAENDLKDIGFYGTYKTGNVLKYTGFFRDSDDNSLYKLFHNLTSEPEDGIVNTTLASNYDYASLQVDTVKAETSNVSGNSHVTGNMSISSGMFYLNQATPGVDAEGVWRINIDEVNKIMLFQVYDSTTSEYITKFNIKNE